MLANTTKDKRKTYLLSERTHGIWFHASIDGSHIGGPL